MYMLYRVLTSLRDSKQLQAPEQNISKDTSNFIHLDNLLGLKLNLELKHKSKALEEMKIKTEIIALKVELSRKLVNFELHQENKVEDLISRLYLMHSYAEALRNVTTKLQVRVSDIIDTLQTSPTEYDRKNHQWSEELKDLFASGNTTSALLSQLDTRGEYIGSTIRSVIRENHYYHAIS